MKQASLACLSGLFLGLAWLAHPLFSFVGFVPLLYLAGKVNVRRFAGLCYGAFLIWHIVATWWLPYTDVEAGILMFCVVPALFCVPMVLAYRLSKTTLWAFPIVWISYEYLQYQWDFLWSWLTLGNCLAYQTDWIQFYQWTGTLGGSVWIWIMNIAIYQKKWLLTVLMAFVPIAFSLVLQIEKAPQASPTHEILLVQPNLDPLKEKLPQSPTAISTIKQAERLTALVRTHITPKTDLVIFPESALGRWFELSGLDHKGNYAEWDTLRNFFDQYPETAFLIGLNVYRWVQGEEKNDFTSHQEGDSYRKRYNVTILYQNKQKQYHFKSKRVPSGEYLPFPHFLKPILPAISQTITVEDTTKPLIFQKHHIKIGSLICYESTFGGYVGKVRRQGADILCVVTEDAYWRDTPQPLQHLRLDQLRAVEHQVPVLRVSNHGFSGLITAKGKLVHFSKLNSREVVSLHLPTQLFQNKTLTFYSLWGDWVGLVALLLFCGLIIVFLQKCYF